METFRPHKPMRYPRADGTTMTQIELYDLITNVRLDLSPIAKVVEPLTRSAQAKLSEESYIPEIAIIRY